jgi:hypothetical protein
MRIINTAHQETLKGMDRISDNVLDKKISKPNIVRALTKQTNFFTSFQPNIHLVKQSIGWPGLPVCMSIFVHIWHHKDFRTLSRFIKM